jgi:hypothetical protein
MDRPAMDAETAEATTRVVRASALGQPRLFEGTVVPSQDDSRKEAIAHEFMARRRRLIEPTTRDHPLSHDLYSDSDKG